MDFVRVDVGSLISVSGFAKSAVSWEACWETGVKARFLRGRLERRSADVGMASGMGSDMVVRLMGVWPVI